MRKVQFTGNSSYVISLPIEWVRSMQISKNEPLGIRMQSDGSLLILPHPSLESAVREKELRADVIKDPTFLFRCMVGSYIAGHTSIRVISSTTLPPLMRKAARDFTQMTIGQQIVEETDSSIVIKDLLNPVEMPFDNSIKRMYIIVKTMFKDAILSLENKDKILAKDIVNRDTEVDKLQWLISRQYHLLLEDLALSEKMQISLKQALNYYVVSRILERVGDHGVRFATHIPTLIDHRIDQKVVADINNAVDLAMAILDSSIRSIFSGNLSGANRTIDSVSELETVSDGITTIALQKKGEIALSIGYIAESIRRAGEYGADISEAIINQLIDEEKSD
ncbi:MAG: phosphate uptake regulator PhoU [Methanomicrobiales archaeon]|nr:phosphate uptake regulator PhoU [Methanomicrobiales archaeon]